MGLSSSRNRRGSEECRSSDGSARGSRGRRAEEARDFNKSVSMPALDDRRRAPPTAVPPSGSSEKKMVKPASTTSIRRSDSAAQKNGNGFPRQKSIRRDISHPISVQGREIIAQCFDNPHSEFGNKVCQRVFEKRPDYQNYVYQLGKERAYTMTQKLKDLVESVVQRIDDVDFIMSSSRTYGEDHVELKTLGFKPDFWVALADAMTIEGVILDMASHQPADTVGAWSQLVSLIFSSVRDGYYSALRQHRMNSRRNLARQATCESGVTDTSTSGPCSSRQNSLCARSTEYFSKPARASFD